jgi:Ca-activated chloride channel family protein
MNPYARFALVVSVLAAIVLPGCGPAAPAATRMPAATEAPKALAATRQMEAVAPAPAAAPTPAPAATMVPGDGSFGPSTGGTTEPNGQPYGDVFFKNYGVNPFIDTEDDHFSTFAVDVDTASYTVMRRFVGDGNLPPSEAVRVEEYVNYFKQDYQPPAEGEGAFAIHLEGAPSPYGGERYYLARVGLKGYEVPAEERKDVVLTFVIDVSGSMGRENRLGLVKQALQLLVQELRPTDKVGIAVYGTNGRTLLEHTAVADGERILRAIDQLRPEGATNAEQGLVIGYGMAAKAFNARAINRVILCSDGVANVGDTASDAILKQIRRYAEENIYLTTVGFGMGNYNDILMEQLADDGNGFYAYVDTLDEAERIFVRDLTSTLQVIAKDAKIQVDFNPAVVKSYRLIGYENRDVADQDFRNDKVDAGEIGAGHSVTALYEVKFQADAPESEAALTVYVRYQDPTGGEVTEVSRSMTRAEFAPAFQDASPRFQLDAVVAEYAEILHESYWAKGSSLVGVAEEARRIAKALPRDPDVVEFAGLVERAASLQE